MHTVLISLLALVTLTGCASLHAHLPEEMIRHIARKDGVEISAICSHEGQSYSEGATVCMTKRRMTCDLSERWVHEGSY